MNSYIVDCPKCKKQLEIVRNESDLSNKVVRCIHCYAVFKAQIFVTFKDQILVDQTRIKPELRIACANTFNNVIARKKQLKTSLLSESLTAKKISTQTDGAKVAPKAKLIELNKVKLNLSDNSSIPKVQIPDPKKIKIATKVDNADDEIVSRLQQYQKARWWQLLFFYLLFFALSFLLAIQVLTKYQTDILLAYPKSYAVLQPVFKVLGKSVKPIANLAVLKIADTSFQRTDNGIYRLTLLVDNQSAAKVVSPALLLTILDDKNEVLIKKVLYLHELNYPSSNIAPNAKVAIRALLHFDYAGIDKKMNSYAMSLFYP